MPRSALKPKTIELGPAESYTIKSGAQSIGVTVRDVEDWSYQFEDQDEVVVSKGDAVFLNCLDLPQQNAGYWGALTINAIDNRVIIEEIR